MAFESTSQNRYFHYFFYVLVAWGALIFWLAPHPPMVDFPQHAAQVSLLKDLLTGKSPWAAQLQINLVTPYLTGYGLATLLSFVMPVLAAMKLLLSVAYILFVVVCVAFRKRVSADARLDWIFVPTFFGFCYAWGMFTFMLAAPIGLFFILLADKYAAMRTPKRGLMIVAVGILLLISHGMTFVLGWGAGLVLLALRLPRRWKALSAYLPYLVLLVAGFVFYRSGKQLDAAIIQAHVPWDFGSSPLYRLKEAVLFPFSTEAKMGSDLALVPVILAIAIAPFAFGLRINWRHPAAWSPFACVCILFFVLPNNADNTALLYSRYSLFLLPTYAWLFAPVATHGAAPPRSKAVWPGFAETMLIAACIFVLGASSLRVWRFAQETREFDAKIAQLAPGQRALGMIFDASSQAAESRVVYLHYPAWYQAERKGLTDFNFAWFTPQVVRYRPGSSPAVSIGFEWNPGSFDWARHEGARYRYFLVRGSHQPAQLFRDAPCMPKVVVDAAMWKVYENCAAAGGLHTD